MPAGTLQGLFRFLIQAFDDLEASIPLEKLEEIAVIVYSAMSNPARHYHNLDHVFNFSDPPDPIRYLAAVFHDIVYYQVDGGVSPELEAYILPYIQRKNDQFFLVESLPEAEKRVSCLLELFGYTLGQAITFRGGLNEFLSALVTVKLLSGFIQDQQLFAVVLCVEATIPFRGPDDDGRRHFEVMADRLYAMRDRYPFLGSKSEIDAMLIRAVIFSNQDVETFSLDDPAGFLDITFRLLPESNADLRKQGVYTIRQYRAGLQNMEHFMRALNPECVFNQYKGFPGEKEYRVMVRQARKNLSIALSYLEIKLLTMALLEGLAEATGGDAPLSLFMGDLPREGVVIERMEDYLPEVTLPDYIDPGSDLLRLLSGGLSELGFDLHQSLTSLFIFINLTEEERRTYFESALAFFEGELTAEEFLAKTPKRLLHPIARAIAEMVFTRREKLKPYMG